MTMLSFGHRGNSRVHLWTRHVALCLTLFICGHRGYAQTSQTSITELNDQIDLTRRLIRVAEHDHISNGKQANLWAQLALQYAHLADFARAEDAYFHSLHLLENTPASQANYATVLDNIGVFYLAFNRREEAKSYLQRALTLRKELDDRMALGVSQVHLAEIFLTEHKFKDAEDFAAEAQANLTAAGESGRKGLIGALVALAYARCSRNNCVEGSHNAEQALEFAHIAFPSDTLPVGHVLMAIGFAKWKSGDYQEAEKVMLQGIQIITTQNVPGAPYSRNALLEYRTFLQARHRTMDVRRIDDQLASMTTQPCTNCTVSIYGLSNSMR